ncbi:MAG: hypothetical protein CVV05_05395 [Gammaproteobacteria bacterium HGW-Gammaproteobacteria-1]|jgi:CHASE3 domain sensor protein|nr:MAG: hypothetical protein CVV05_05395 [Gammaproteobacteria bacterium HGW-Gammaproteobacteria-1]
MSAKGLAPIVSEYHILWEALKHYEERLEKLSSMTTDEDQQLKYDEKLQDINGLLRSVKIAAQSDYNLELK